MTAGCLMEIFDNQEKVIKNIHGSAENLGIKESEKKREVRLFAKKNCKKCYGIGSFRHVGVDGKESILNCSCARYFQVEVEQ